MSPLLNIDTWGSYFDTEWCVSNWGWVWLISANNSLTWLYQLRIIFWYRVGYLIENGHCRYQPGSSSILITLILFGHRVRSMLLRIVMVDKDLGHPQFWLCQLRILSQYRTCPFFNFQTQDVVYLKNKENNNGWYWPGPSSIETGMW